ncbi:MAG TPA: ABC transporter substrate-binding protein [Flexilinea sp.]|nr:ABC transporter substrate-binding protein [Flexilinea sp.]
MKKNILYVVLFLLIFAVLPVNAAGDTLVIGVATDMTGMDPHQQTAFTSMKVLEMMYGQLVEVNENMEVVPSMAESWEWSEDGMHLTMHLVPEMTFHDGSPVTSADVKYSFERILNEETAAAARSTRSSRTPARPSTRSTRSSWSAARPACPPSLTWSRS